MEEKENTELLGLDRSVEEVIFEAKMAPEVVRDA